MLVISVFQHLSLSGPCIVYSQRCSLQELGIDAAVAHSALSSETARAVRLGSIPRMTKRLLEDHHRHEWFDVHVGCCTSGSIRTKRAAMRNFGVTSTDQWFITAARSSAAGKEAPLSIHNGLLTRDERCLNSELVVHDRGGPGGVLRIAAEALQVDRPTAGGPCADKDQGMLEQVSCCKCGCGKFRCVAAEIMTRRETRRAAPINACRANKELL